MMTDEDLSKSIFDIQSTHIRTGDLVIVYHVRTSHPSHSEFIQNSINLDKCLMFFKSRDNLSAIVVTPGQILRSKYGEFSHHDMVGVPFGSKVSQPTSPSLSLLFNDPSPIIYANRSQSYPSPKDGFKD